IANRIQKVLEDANIKLASVASDVLGASGRLMLQAIMGGNSDVNGLADLSKGRLRAKIRSYAKRWRGKSPGIIACFSCAIGSSASFWKNNSAKPTLRSLGG